MILGRVNLEKYHWKVLRSYFKGANMESVTEIKNRFNNSEVSKYRDLIEEYGTDSRKGVQNILKSANKKIEAYNKEILRLHNMKSFERKYSSFEHICGIDEAGRGPFAGPVVAGAVILPKDCNILYLNDSKKLSAKKREELFSVIKENAIAYSVGFASPKVIDAVNILQATYLAMREAINKLNVKPDILLNDAVVIPDVDIQQESIIKGDAKSVSIAAASIIAKVTRDHLMIELDKEYPEYGFAQNKGYGTAEHIEAIKQYGPCSIHRRSFIHSYTSDGR